MTTYERKDRAEHMICAILYPSNYIILFSRTANQSPYRHLRDRHHER